MREICFALYFGNRGFFPGELIKDARQELTQVVEQAGYRYIMMDESLTRFGAVETMEEGLQYAKFLKEHQGEYDGIILCLPNFGDENGALVALEGVNVPILVQAYPDELDKMDFTHRRDAVCGKIAMCNCLRQRGMRYTLTDKIAESPSSEDFAKDLEKFAAICRVVSGMRHVHIGAIGARTTAFKTVRCDEIAMLRKGVDIEDYDLSDIMNRMENVDCENARNRAQQLIQKFSGLEKHPEKADHMARLAIVLDELIKTMKLDAVAVRCWDELEKKLGIAPCLVMSELNNRLIPAACEMDLNNALMMLALQLAGNSPVMLLDVNNNYGEDLSKCILFHCSAVPSTLMSDQVCVGEHLMFKKIYGAGSGIGIASGKILDGEVTMGSMKTEDGRIHAFISEGRLTDDPVGEGFFGCGVVFEKDNMKDLFHYLCENGYRHHVALVPGHYAEAVAEAMNKYLDYDAQQV